MPGAAVANKPATAPAAEVGLSGSRRSAAAARACHFRVVSAKLFVHLAPAFAADVWAGVHDHLSRFLMKPMPELGGVLVAYSDVAILEEAGKVMYDSPYVHFHIRATFTLFSPLVGAPIVGIVNKVSADHIGLLVCGVFNASVPKEQIRLDEFVWNDEVYEWQSTRDGGCTINVGTILRLTRVNGMLAVSGSLTVDPDNTGVLVVDAKFADLLPELTVAAAADGAQDAEAETTEPPPETQDEDSQDAAEVGDDEGDDDESDAEVYPAPEDAVSMMEVDAELPEQSSTSAAHVPAEEPSEVKKRKKNKPKAPTEAAIDTDAAVAPTTTHQEAPKKKRKKPAEPKPEPDLEPKAAVADADDAIEEPHLQERVGKKRKKEAKAAAQQVKAEATEAAAVQPAGEQTNEKKKKKPKKSFDATPMPVPPTTTAAAQARAQHQPQPPWPTPASSPGVSSAGEQFAFSRATQTPAAARPTPPRSPPPTQSRRSVAFAAEPAVLLAPAPPPAPDFSADDGDDEDSEHPPLSPTVTSSAAAAAPTSPRSRPLRPLRPLHQSPATTASRGGIGSPVAAGGMNAATATAARYAPLASLAVVARHFAHGIADAFAWPTSLITIYGSRTIQLAAAKCLAVNAAVFLGSWAVLNFAIPPVVLGSAAAASDPTTRDLPLTAAATMTIRDRMLLALAPSYYVLCMFPIYALGFLLNAPWYQQVADRAYQIVYSKPVANPQTYDWLLKRAADESYRLLLLLNYALAVALAAALPRPVGPTLAFLLCDWLVAFLCFEYKWASRGWTLDRRIEYFENRWAYFAGF
ncbi:Etoposide induced 2.4 mRNA, partial [Cladochytrium tenue]